jgi:hypothetical protein
MMIVIGVAGMALLFGLFTIVRGTSDDGCTGHCAGCARDAACESKEGRRGREQ